ncbi:hypothetical protein CHR53_06395 [Neobacillus mesonae]|uniref:Uncharacterized protein n=1 Tax=Neobacillus mesonae TaxID=1193713 RepID=A0A3Q9QSZ1_9BACI|nr:hypothetical protein CHR53_06395 [Neobacillus mesonae]
MINFYFLDYIVLTRKSVNKLKKGRPKVIIRELVQPIEGVFQDVKKWRRYLHQKYPFIYKIKKGQFMCSFEEA